MRDDNPWRLRLLLVPVSAAFSAITVSGSILLISYFVYNPWFRAGGDREGGFLDFLSRASDNVGEHAIYMSFFLLSGPFWVYGRRVGLLAPAIWTVLFSVLTALFAFFLFYSHLDIGVILNDLNDDRINYVIFWNNIYVPNYIYITGVFTLPAATGLAYITLNTHFALRRSNSAATAAPTTLKAQA
jgi:hypothetical protein